MIRNQLGEPVHTNARRRESDCIEVVLAFPTLIGAFEEWLSERGLYLFPIPIDGDNLPAYGVGVLSEADLSIRPGTLQAGDGS
jgi:hypothetical protein